MLLNPQRSQTMNETYIYMTYQFLHTHEFIIPFILGALLYILRLSLRVFRRFSRGQHRRNNLLLRRYHTFCVVQA